MPTEKPASLRAKNDKTSKNIKKIIDDFKSKKEKFWRNAPATLKSTSNTLKELNKYTDFIDKNIKSTLKSLPVKDMPALVAVGGYGRRELAPFSDIDVLFVCAAAPSAETRRWITDLTAILWSCGLKLSHTVKTVAECEADMASDIHFLTSLLEKRYVAGDRRNFVRLAAAFTRHRTQTPAGNFIAAKLQERDDRHRKLGDTRLLLQPNVKESKGGLRDIQTIFWISSFLFRIRTADRLVKKDLLTKKEAASLAKAHAFFTLVRMHLHLLAGRAEDRLTFELQPDLAARLGYTEKEPNRRAEAFMQDYFHMATETGYLTRLVCAGLESLALGGGATSGTRKLSLQNAVDGFPVLFNRLTVADKKIFTRTPAAAFRLFRAAQTSGLDIHPDALRLLRAALEKTPSMLHKNAEAFGIFLDILTDPRKSAQTLRRLNEAGLLTALIPDFGNIFAHMQYDMYHVFTADEHTINTVDMMHALENSTGDDGHLAASLFRSIARRRALYVAMFFHDMGKGTGGSHAEKSAALVRKYAPKLGLDDAETETAAWLAENHLLMTMTILKRDLNDDKTIADFAAIVQSPERLKLLTILTTADIMGVGPGRWNSWKADMLAHLYARAQQELSGTEDATADDARVESVLTALRAQLPQKKAALDYLAQNAPVSFWLALSQTAHLAVIDALHGHTGAADSTVIRIENDAVQDMTTVYAFTPDRKGLFSTLSGAFAAAGASITQARIFTLANGMALDIFRVQDARGHAYDNTAFLEKTLVAALGEKLSIDAEIRDRQKQAPRRNRLFTVAPQVIADNNASNQHTVLEVNGRDRIGLLYDITRAISDSGLQISSAKVATFGSRAVDVFYLKDASGVKIRHPETLERLEKRIRDALLGAK